MKPRRSHTSSRRAVSKYIIRRGEREERGIGVAQRAQVAQLQARVAALADPDGGGSLLVERVALRFVPSLTVERLLERLAGLTRGAAPN